MIKANFKAYATYVTDSLYQWDINQKLEVLGLNLSVAPEVHFSNATMDRAIVRQATLENNIVYADIPNSLLQMPLKITAHIGVYSGKTFNVVEKVEIPIKARPRPADYRIEDSDEEIYSFKALENEIVNAKTNFENKLVSAKTELENDIAKKADSAVVNARIDTIIAHNNDTEGNTELIDMRVGSDGKTHGSAGEAVRFQIDNISKLADYFSRGISLNDFFENEDNSVIYSYVSNGGVVCYSEDGQIWTRTVNIPIDPRVYKKLYIKDFIIANSYISNIAFYSDPTISTYDTYISNFIADNFEPTDTNIYPDFYQIDIPENAKSFIVTYKGGQKPTVVLELNATILSDIILDKEDTLRKLNDSKRYIPIGDAHCTIGKHVNGLTGAYGGSGVYRVLSFDITNMKKSGATHISTFVQTFAFRDDNNEGYAFFKYGENGEKIYISGGIASKIQTIEDVIIEIPDEATVFELSWVSEALYGAKYRDIGGIYFLTSAEYNNSKRIGQLENDIDLMNKKLDIIDATQYSGIVLGGTIYAVVGDTIQLFYKSFLDCDIDNLIVKFSCPKGKNYPRYWEYTPVSSDEGDYTIDIEITDKKGNIIDSGSVTLTVISAKNPARTVNVLCVGDSTMLSGQIPVEASRRLKGTVGVATAPSALSLNNLTFVGRRKNSDNTVGWEGNGGWTYDSYNTLGVRAVRFTVKDATDINIGAGYSINSFRFEITEINVTNGVGNIRGVFSYLTPYSSEFNNTAESGTLTLVSGNGQNTITYTAWESEYYQPFWNNETNAFDIISYRDDYCNGAIDVICTLLGVNSLIGGNPLMDVSNIINTVKTFFNNVHAQLPNCKILASTIPLASHNGGIGANYGAWDNSGAYNANGFNHKIIAFNKALIALAQSDEYKGYVTIINSHAQFDADNCYPSGTKAVNTRLSDTEIIQNNAVHPTNAGYWQLADALAFRGLLGVLSE